MTIDTPPAVDMVLHPRKEFADEAFFKQALKQPKEKLSKLIQKDLELSPRLHQDPFAFKVVPDYVRGEWEKEAAVQVNLIVKKGESADCAKTKSGKYGASIKIFGESDAEKDPVVLTEFQTNEDAFNKGLQLGKEVFR